MISRLAVSFCLLAAPTFAQSLTPEEIAAMVEERLNTPNPYAELLNNPDLDRALGAMEIMFESGDEALVDMALEFGLLSVNPAVRRAAFEAYLRSKPTLIFRFDGSEIDGGNYVNHISRLNGMLTPERIGFWRLPVGDYDSENRCYRDEDDKACFITINADGVLWQVGSTEGRLDLGETGELTGTTRFSGVVDLVPTSMQLLN